MEGDSNAPLLTWEAYQALLNDRPVKATADQVGYRRGEGNQICLYCTHFYECRARLWAVCEIVRLDPEESIDPNFTCNFYNSDFEAYPLLPAAEEQPNG